MSTRAARTAEQEPVAAALAGELRLAIGRLHRRLRTANAGEHTESQLSAIAALHARGPVCLGELATGEGVSPASMSRTVDRLVELGLAAWQQTRTTPAGTSSS